MDVSGLTPSQRRIRDAVRDFLLLATREELEREKQISLDKGDQFRVDCIQEIIDDLTI